MWTYVEFFYALVSHFFDYPVFQYWSSARIIGQHITVFILTFIKCCSLLNQKYLGYLDIAVSVHQWIADSVLDFLYMVRISDKIYRVSIIELRNNGCNCRLSSPSIPCMQINDRVKAYPTCLVDHVRRIGASLLRFY